MPVTQTEQSYSGAIRTTDGVATDVPGLTWTVADKSVETYDIVAWAVREDTPSPSVAHSRHIATVHRAGGSASLCSSGDTNPRTIVQHDSEAGSSPSATLVVSGVTATVRVTGTEGRTFHWRLRVTRTVLTSD